MPGIYMFSEAQLKTLKLADLKKLASYYGIKFGKNVKPSDLIDLIIEKQGNYSTGELVDNEPVSMSVRVRRIYNKSHGEWK